MTFVESVKTCFSKYVTFSGRAVRSEFWWWVLFVFVANMVLTWVDIALFGVVETGPGSIAGSTSTPIFSGLFGLATLLPGISVSVRRMHDTNRSGWWLWIALIPIIGFILLIVWFATDGTRGPNNYGFDPKDSSGSGDMGGGYEPSNVPNVPRS